MPKLRFDQQQLYWEGKPLYSVNAPEQSARHKLPISIEVACLYVVPGPALGYGIGELLQLLPSTSRILLLEPEPELAAFSQKHLERLLRNERVHFQGPCLKKIDGNAGAKNAEIRLIQSLYEFLERGDAWRMWCFRRIRILALNRLYALKRGSYEPVINWLQHYLQNFWQNRLTLEKLGALWLRNFFRNVGQLQHCQPFGLHGNNLVLAAAGPSLAWHYDWLRAERQHFTLLAVDTALLPLLQAGIVPDYVMNLDAQVLNLYDFYGVGHLLQGKEITLIADLSANPQSFSMLPGPFQLTATRFADFELWRRFRALTKGKALVSELEPLGSVGISALAVALQSQAEFLLLVGYDFAYPKDLHHARGTSIHEKLLHNCGRTRSCNSFAAAQKRPLLEDQQRLAEGFVTDRILYTYVQQLQGYLERHSSGVRYARLAGPLELPSIPVLKYTEVHNQFSAAEGKARAIRVERPGFDRPIQDFWTQELKILQELSANVKRENFWPESGFAADYLLKLCLPKSGSCEWQDCDWGKILYMSRNFSEQLTALLDSQN